ncbi:hypothetical protein [Bacillus marinisedimentorum]|uniref:hypothetical protein n=1 Tax=Bacillus marinisedimentorum TaxID=1821260 RepID=UPI000872E53D|nr:hypothetical protein [Bacillus marinisedimentorum]
MTPNNHDEVSIAGTLTYSDYKRHNAYHRKKFVLGYFVLGILVFMYVYSNVVSGSWILVYPVVAFFSIISSGLITTIMVLLMNMRVRREYKSDQIIKNEISYVFSDDGINQKV